ncbi:MAG: cytochrome c oxidase subunit 3 [Dehalococcoidia bacterium]|nr:cytochrome c oxidase subunit 3 [Dehalococcoidia bacterium]
MTTEHAVEHGIHSPEMRVKINRIGLWLFILSDAFFFVALISSRFYLHGTYRPDDLNQALGLGVSIVLLLSSLTVYRAEVAASYGDRAATQRNILFTIGLGLLFAVGVGYEWYEAFSHFPPSTGFGTIFFTLTGVHATHVFSGLIVLGFLWWLNRRGKYSSEETYWPVEGAAKYWHFVDVAWVLIYPTLYLVS